MTRKLLKSLLLVSVSGAVMFQAGSCADVATGVTAVATTVTAGGVIYLIFRVLE